VRRVYLGTVFGLTPSHKFYMPFACSNVWGCDVCHGTTMLAPRVKNRVQKKRYARKDRAYRIVQKQLRGYVQRDEYGHVPTPVRIQAVARWKRACKFSELASCPHCGGSGSREAHLDSIWRESVESAFESIGVTLANGDGDPCDLFAEEYREAEMDLDPLENEDDGLPFTEDVAPWEKTS
jgi:hypothetical protein